MGMNALAIRNPLDVNPMLQVGECPSSIKRKECQAGKKIFSYVLLINQRGSKESTVRMPSLKSRIRE
jgi:hypothetical protein